MPSESGNRNTVGLDDIRAANLLNSTVNGTNGQINGTSLNSNGFSTKLTKHTNYVNKNLRELLAQGLISKQTVSNYSGKVLSSIEMEQNFFLTLAKGIVGAMGVNDAYLTGLQNILSKLIPIKITYDFDNRFRYFYESDWQSLSISQDLSFYEDIDNTAGLIKVKITGQTRETKSSFFWVRSMESEVKISYEFQIYMLDTELVESMKNGTRNQRQADEKTNEDNFYGPSPQTTASSSSAPSPQRKI